MAEDPVEVPAVAEEPTGAPVLVGGLGARVPPPETPTPPPERAALEGDEKPSIVLTALIVGNIEVSRAYAGLTGNDQRLQEHVSGHHALENPGPSRLIQHRIHLP